MGWILQTDGQASEVRIACLHTISSRSVLCRLYGEDVKPNLEWYRKHRDSLLERASKNNLVQAFASAKDVHRVGASLILDKEEPEVTKEERVDAKTVTLGRQFGRGYRAIAAQYGIDEEIMRVRVEKWDAVFPEFTTLWHPAVKEFAMKNGFVVSLFGLVRRVDELVWSSLNEWQHKGLRESVNSPVQGDSHLWISKGITWLHRNYLSDRRVKTIIIDDLHDAILTDCPNEELDKTCIKQVMSILSPYFDPYNYPWLVCDLATELEIHRPWGSKWAAIMFNTATMEDKHRPDFNLEDAVAEIYFEGKKKMKEPPPLKP